MSFFSGLSGLADSFGDMFHDVAEIGLTSRMGDSLFSGGDHHDGLSSFGETATNFTMANSLGDYDGGSF
ncbi:MAG: hypothetical protein V4525_09605 [Pseudomonadota bacterium]